MNINYWTKEMDQFLIDNYEKMVYDDLAEVMTERFGRKITKYAIFGRLRNLREKYGYTINKKPSKRKPLWTKEMDEVLLKNYMDTRYEDLADLISKQFNVKISLHSIARRVAELKANKRLHWTKAMDHFLIENYNDIGPKELAPIMSNVFKIHVTSKAMHQRAQRLNVRINEINCPIGTEHDYGYCIRVKVNDYPPNEREKWTDNWVLKQKYIWEQANGPVPEHHCIIFADGDNRNFELSNLRCIPTRYKLQMVRQLSNDIFKEGPEMIDAGIAWCELYYNLREVKEKVDERA